jgi:hypothetical protein
VTSITLSGVQKIHVAEDVKKMRICSTEINCCNGNDWRFVTVYVLHVNTETVPLVSRQVSVKTQSLPGLTLVKGRQKTIISDKNDRKRRHERFYRSVEFQLDFLVSSAYD